MSFTKFYKVSKEQFLTDCGKYSYITANDCYDNIELPKRATSGSAGYDFYMPFSITLRPGGTCTVPTGIKFNVDQPGCFLMIVPRSGLGFKFQLGFANTVGIIDGDYFNNPDNEGHIFMPLRNFGKYPARLNMGERVCQGIFEIHGLVTGDDATGIRSGGFGSTGN